MKLHYKAPQRQLSQGFNIFIDSYCVICKNYAQLCGNLRIMRPDAIFDQLQYAGLHHCTLSEALVIIYWCLWMASLSDISLQFSLKSFVYNYIGIDTFAELYQFQNARAHNLPRPRAIQNIFIGFLLTEVNNSSFFCLAVFYRFFLWLMIQPTKANNVFNILIVTKSEANRNRKREYRNVTQRTLNR